MAEQMGNGDCVGIACAAGVFQGKIWMCAPTLDFVWALYKGLHVGLLKLCSRGQPSGGRQKRLWGLLHGDTIRESDSSHDRDIFLQ